MIEEQAAGLNDPPQRRVPEDVLAKAKMRARLGASRVALKHPFLNPVGRGGARRSGQITPITAAQLPEISLICELMLAKNHVDIVLDAAAAALLSSTISNAITPDAINAIPVSRAAREFGLSHSYLAMTPEEMPQIDAFSQVKAELYALLAANLPEGLADKCSTVSQPLKLPPPPVQCLQQVAPQPKRRAIFSPLSKRHKQYVLPLASEFPIEDRAEAALLTAIKAFLR